MHMSGKYNSMRQVEFLRQPQQGQRPMRELEVRKVLSEWDQ